MRVYGCHCQYCRIGYASFFHFTPGGSCYWFTRKRAVLYVLMYRPTLYSYVKCFTKPSHLGFRGYYSGEKYQICKVKNTIFVTMGSNHNLHIKNL